MKLKALNKTIPLNSSNVQTLYYNSKLLSSERYNKEELILTTLLH